MNENVKMSKGTQSLFLHRDYHLEKKTQKWPQLEDTACERQERTHIGMWEIEVLALIPFRLSM